MLSAGSYNSSSYRNIICRTQAENVQTGCSEDGNEEYRTILSGVAHVPGRDRQISYQMTEKGKINRFPTLFSELPTTPNLGYSAIIVNY
jgi:hypothetical protein